MIIGIDRLQQLTIICIPYLKFIWAPFKVISIELRAHHYYCHLLVGNVDKILCLPFYMFLFRFIILISTMFFRESLSKSTCKLSGLTIANRLG
ncbi:hypothetical protein BDF19DRAFT_29515 [Syncephalis fuscata]|nr:hypothetical protein BDF19DRAFT_29515 [Syncephalis fuscata]